MSAPITGEIEGEEAMRKLKEQNDYLDEITDKIDTLKNSNESNKGDDHLKMTSSHTVLFTIRC